MKEWIANAHPGHIGAIFGGIILLIMLIAIAVIFIKEDKQNMNDKNTFDELLRRANYALNSKSLALAYEVYGACCMARRLEAITHDEYMRLNTMIVREGINNPSAGLE